MGSLHQSRCTDGGMNVEVLIVGAGPTGLMLANQLGRRGVRAMIIDRHSGPAQETRAVAVQARTLEIYAKLGVAERALELGQRGTGVITSYSIHYTKLYERQPLSPAPARNGDR